MASIFTYDPDPPRVSSPWSTSGSSTPQVAVASTRILPGKRSSSSLARADPDVLSDYGITKLEPEPQEGPTEYKLHLLLRLRRLYTSMSTGNVVGGSYHVKTSPSPSAPIPSSLDSNQYGKPPQSRSSQSRQQRLQQLTTQLLWRLQQSSPFHSSTAGNLVLPVLPDATPQLGVPQKPARLIPGLEESQGALYEIGVADDGTFVGLTVDEMEESLGNLQAMAASLGCKVDIIRRVIVGKCEWPEEPCGETGETLDVGKVRTDNLWVAEALVSPDWDFYRVQSPQQAPGNGDPKNARTAQDTLLEDRYSSTEQIRISITGPTTAGKSSLLGTLTSSVLDNGRGTSRLSLLKHRHEISSGITSSVAHELIGYAPCKSPASTTDVINYASGNVAAWDDVHAASQGGRLAFVSDLPGSVRYLKSTLRGLISWAPHYALLCIPANCDDGASQESTNGAGEQTTDINLAISYLDLCLKLEVPTILVITKMDLASRGSLRNNLAKILSTLKNAGKKPAMLPVSTVTTDGPVDLQHIGQKDGEEVRKTIPTADTLSSTVPIVLTSAVDGSGVGKLHAFLRYLPIPAKPPSRTISLPRMLVPSPVPTNIFDVDEVFAIPPSKVYSASMDNGHKENTGVVLCGLVRYGAISTGDELVLGPLLVNTLSDQRSETQPSGSYRSRPPSGEWSTSFVQGLLSGKAHSPTQAHWQRVRVVSVRNLRLPVQKLTVDQVGTIGVEPLPCPGQERPQQLGKVRKGTVLVSLPASVPAVEPSFHKGFVASFPASEFSDSLSPPLLLGGHAIVYMANVRSTVKVTCMALAEDEVISTPPSPTEPEFFDFDSDPTDGFGGSGSEVNKVVRSAGTCTQEDVKITFAFVTTVEWVEIGTRVLLMPGASTALASAPSTTTPTGLEGFVGRVCDVLNAHEAS
ncbi:hypothetical protein FE257_012899 [Aspergillus nanangensis]|uniref:Tr-type G domain-containing protein n=1 Tax=Aspergillus nanangensis TaxID=2582783 RepID=A0AAD4GRK2_ASPNN|nr:hypothetical protein FE257_012899 [Aspergillus nanangensis]